MDRGHAALAVEGLAVARAGRTVVADVSFRLAGGEALQVTGPNGTGKSTLLRAIAGLLPSQAGHVGLVGGARNAARTEQLHYLGHADGLKGAMTARENLAFATRLLGGPAGLPPHVALASLGLAHVVDLPVAYLSAGQRRRVALARLVVAPRLLWLLDEPATALDAAAREALAHIMTQHLSGGGLIVAATHAPLGLADAGELRLAA